MPGFRINKHALAMILSATITVCSGQTWKAPSDPKGAPGRKLLEEETIEVRLNVAIMDYDGLQHPHMDVDFVDENGTHREGYFLGTQGNLGSLMPHCLSHNRKVRLTGWQEMGEEQTRAMKAELCPNSQREGRLSPTGNSSDNRPVFVISQIECLEEAPGTNRRLAGNAPSTLKALVILVTVCNTELVWTTPAKMQDDFFGDTDSYASLLGQCSRSTVDVTGSSNPYLFARSQATSEVCTLQLSKHCNLIQLGLLTTFTS